MPPRSRKPKQPPLIVDLPVGPHSDPREIHLWLDELDALRRAYAGEPEAAATIDEAIARAVGWLHGRDELAGAGP